MKCTKCDEELDAGAVFCGNCGQPVAAPTQVSASATATAPPSASTPAPQPAPVAEPAPAPSSVPVPVAEPASAPVTPVPAYAVPSDLSKPGGGKAIASFVLGILGLLGWIIPIVGLPMGVIGLILGSTSLKSSHRRLAIAGIVLSSIVVVASVMLWVYSVEQDTSAQPAQKTGANLIAPLNQ